VPPEKLLYKHLATTSGDVDLNTSSSGTDYLYTVPAENVAVVERLNIIMSDAEIDFEKFGGIVALTNGLKIEVLDAEGTVTLDFTDGQEIKTNADFGYLAGSDVVGAVAAGSLEDFQIIRWTIGKTGAGLFLEAGEFVRFVVQDPLNEITLFRVMVQGIIGTVKEMNQQP
jgi:hypothetical protein